MGTLFGVRPDGWSDTLRRVAIRGAIVTSIFAIVTATAGPTLVDGVKLMFDKCTPMQQKQVEQAVRLAVLALDATIADLTGDKLHLSVPIVVNRWFGAGASQDAIAENLADIADRLDSGAEPIRCVCNPGLAAIARTFRAMKGEGYLELGHPFFEAAQPAASTRAWAPSCTSFPTWCRRLPARDVEYDADKMRALARESPASALENAQSYEYLVEELYDR